MKVSVSIDQPSITPMEANVVDMLCDAIKTEVHSLVCPTCKEDGLIILHVNSSKMSSLRTEIKGCCSAYKKIVEDRLAVEA